MLLILGKTCSGKDTFAKELDKLGYKPVISRTTREKRAESDNKYKYVTREQAEKERDKAIAYTEIGDNIYYVLEEDLVSKDYYIIDYKGFLKLEESFPNTDFDIVYLTADEEKRKERFIKRGGTVEQFCKRNIAEKEQFKDFIAITQSRDLENHNIRFLTFLDNKFENNFESFAKEVDNTLTWFENIGVIIDFIIEKDHLSVNSDGKIRVYYTENNEERVKYVSKGNFARILQHDNEGFLYVLDDILGNKNIFKLLAKIDKQ
ncbi:AAA family ATPase [Finegoldia dalianensis]|uniref:AAA family ATPase n=1 Tax=Finegoldia dalianensis TaxID=3145239 RepID=A0ABW9KF39_9FIRM